MWKDFKRVACRDDGIAADAIGCVALMVLLVSSLHLPLVL